MVTVAQIAWINRNVDIVSNLEKLGVVVPYNQKVYCPFHHNLNTPAAKVYVDEENGSGSLYCYTERKHYHTYDVLVKMGYSDADIANMVPKEFWYMYEVGETEPAYVVPRLDNSDRANYSPFEWLRVLDARWNEVNK